MRWVLKWISSWCTLRFTMTGPVDCGRANSIKGCEKKTLDSKINWRPAWALDVSRHLMSVATWRYCVDAIALTLLRWRYCVDAILAPSFKKALFAGEWKAYWNVRLGELRQCTRTNLPLYFTFSYQLIALSLSQKNTMTADFWGRMSTLDTRRSTKSMFQPSTKRRPFPESVKNKIWTNSYGSQSFSWKK